MTVNIASFPAHTRFPAQVRAPSLDPKPSTGLRVLVDGSNNAKLGGRITKGRWRGMRLYTLTLEERATCPTTCGNWHRCYGNNMPFAVRYQAGEQLEIALEADIRELSGRRMRGAMPGFVVRLHVLGDFYDAAYVDHWRWLLARYPRLHCYGYTHWEHGTPIGDAVAALVAEFPDRAAFRRSDGQDPDDPLPASPTVMATTTTPPPGAVLCPEQMGQAPNCVSCGLCFDRRIGVAFRDHSAAGMAQQRRQRQLPTLQPA